MAKTTKELAGPAVSAMASSASEKIKEFYQSHKEIVISVGAATTVYLLMRQKDPKKKENKSVIRGKESAKKSIIKSFISEHS